MTSGTIIDIKRMATHDGPGIRTTIFLKGCSLQCRWCHNPESINPKAEIGFIQKKCVGCGNCIQACPVGAHSIKNDVHTIDRKKCVSCGKCSDACLPGALELHGRKLSATNAVKAVLEDKCFYDNSGGGCTLSGGEPLLQAQFCAEVFTRLKENDIHCAIDTSGAVSWDRFETVLPVTDMFLYDFKLASSTSHAQHTGMSNILIQDNLQQLSKTGKPIEIRIPLIPNVNNDEENLNATGNTLASTNNIVGIKLLPYHSCARSKYESLGKTYNMPSVDAPSPEEITKAQDILQSFGLNIL